MDTKEELIQKLIKDIEVYNEVDEEAIREVWFRNDLERLYEVFSTIEGNEELLKLKELVEWGIYVRFNIGFIIDNHYDEYPDSHNIKIRGHDKFPIEDYWKEMRIRRRIMNEVLSTMMGRHPENQR